MSEIPNTIIDRLGRSEGYLCIALMIFSIASVFFGCRILSEAGYIQLVTWVWASVVGGGAVAAYRK